MAEFNDDMSALDEKEQRKLLKEEKKRFAAEEKASKKERKKRRKELADREADLDPEASPAKGGQAAWARSPVTRSEDFVRPT